MPARPAKLYFAVSKTALGEGCRQILRNLFLVLQDGASFLQVFSFLRI